VVVLVGDDDGAVGEDDLVGDDVVAGEALAGSEEGVATAEDQAGDTDVALAAAGDGALVLDELAVDVPPAGTGADVGRLGGSIVGDGVQQAEVDGDAAVDVVGAGPVGVATGPDGERLADRDEGAQGDRDLLGIAGKDDAGGGELGAVGPVRILAGLVRLATGQENLRSQASRHENRARRVGLD